LPYSKTSLRLVKWLSMARPEAPLVSDLKPEVVRRIVKRRIGEVRKPQIERKAALDAAIEAGHVRFWLRPQKSLSRERQIFIMRKTPLPSCYFASVQKFVHDKEIKFTHPPYGFQVAEGKSFNNPNDIADFLQQYLDQYFPQAKNTPFTIYFPSRSLGRNELPVMTSRPPCVS